jgi:hypothetical protein
MTEHDLISVKYWVDLTVKSLIGIVVTLVGMDYRSVKNSLRELEQKKYELFVQAQVIHVELLAIKDRVERIDNKLDRVK